MESFSLHLLNVKKSFITQKKCLTHILLGKDGHMCDHLVTTLFSNPQRKLRCTGYRLPNIVTFRTRCFIRGIQGSPSHTDELLLVSEQCSAFFKVVYIDLISTPACCSAVLTLLAKLSACAPSPWHEYKWCQPQALPTPLWLLSRVFPLPSSIPAAQLLHPIPGKQLVVNAVSKISGKQYVGDKPTPCQWMVQHDRKSDGSRCLTGSIGSQQPSDRIKRWIDEKNSGLRSVRVKL